MGETDLNSDFTLLSIFTSVLDTSTKVAVKGVTTNNIVEWLFSSWNPFGLFCSVFSVPSITRFPKRLCVTSYLPLHILSSGNGGWKLVKSLFSQLAFSCGHLYLSQHTSVKTLLKCIVRYWWKHSFKNLQIRNIA